MRSFFICLSILICHISFSQTNNSFVQFYDNLGLDYGEVYQIAHLSEDTAVIFSVSQVPDWSDPFDWQPKIRWINVQNGQKIKEYYYFSSNAFDLYPYGAKLINDNIYFVGVVDYGNTSSSYQNEKDYYIAKSDLEGNYEWIELNGDSTKFDRLEDIIIAENGDLVVVGTTKKMPSATPHNSLVCRYDSLGNKIWCRDFLADITKAYCYGVEIDEEGYIYAMGADKSSIFSQKKIFLHKLLPNGDLVWTKYYEIDKWCLPVDMEMAENGNLIISAGVSYDSLQSLVPTFIEINKDGEIEWSRHYWEELEGNGGWGEKFIKTNEGGYAWCINIIKPGNVYEPTLIVTDEFGEPVIVSKFLDLGVLYPEDLIQLEDGSFVILGNHPFTNDSLYTHWILRTNPQGDFVSYVEEEYAEIDVSIFPNPVFDTVFVRFKDENREKSSLKVQLINNDGKLILEDNLYKFEDGKNISRLPSGIYYISLLNHNRIIVTKKMIKNNR